MKIVDFSNVILGRAASRTAKMLLNGETIVIVNAEKAVIRGTRAGIMEKFVQKYSWQTKSNPTRKNGRFSRMPDKLVFFSIQHMVPYQKSRGQNALDRLTVFCGLPKKFEKESAEKWEEIQNKEQKKFLTIAQISENLGLGQRVA